LLLTYEGKAYRLIAVAVDGILKIYFIYRVRSTLAYDNINNIINPKIED